LTATEADELQEPLDPFSRSVRQRSTASPSSRRSDQYRNDTAIPCEQPATVADPTGQRETHSTSLIHGAPEFLAPTGSRARAYASAGDPLAEDPACAYEPI
jgi:hypothetical protein